MNGAVNGTTEDSVDMSAPGSPEDGQDATTAPEPIDEAVVHEDTANSESNPLESEQTPSIGHSTAEHSVDDSISGEMEEKTDDVDNLAEPALINNDTKMENHCSNSNESYNESIIKSEDEGKEPHVEEVLDTSFLKAESVHLGDSEQEADSEDESSEDDGSEISATPRAEDTVSINSDSDNHADDDTSQESQTKPNPSDIIILGDNLQDSQNGTSQSSPSTEVHEIESDTEAVVEAKPEKVPLRRSSRAIKRKRYDDSLENGDESDIEEVAPQDPLRRKTKPIVINDTKALVEMAAKHMRTNQGKKEPTVVIIDTNSIMSGKGPSNQKNALANASLAAQNLYQSIVARGTTVTPVKNSVAQPPAPQPSILPSLTDDMFVVEAPSFIVPYVYEKPSIKPFREFVDTLGNELAEQREREEQEMLAKEREEKEKRNKEREEKRARGEEVEESEAESEKTAEEEPKEPSVDEEKKEEEEKKKKKAEKRERRRQNEDDDVSWDGTSSSESDEPLSDDEGTTVVIKDKVDSIEEIKDMADLTVDKVVTGKSDNYFDCSLGKFFMNIGLNLVQEFVQNDLLKQQNRKMYREKKTGQNTKATETSIISLKKNLEFSKENNAAYAFKLQKCEYCTFKTESMLAMAHHLETPHMKNNVYKCNFCAFEIRSPHDILYHMEAEHNVRGKLERAPAYHQCANCPFEDNGKGKLARHLIPCAKKFKPEQNLAPPIEWEPPAKIPKISRSRNHMMSPYSTFPRGQVGLRQGAPIMTVASYRPRARAPLPTPRPSAPVHGVPILRSGVMVRHAPISYPANNGKNAGPPKSLHQPSISITPLPRHPQPVVPPPNKSSCVICEICDGYIKDLEQLRNHMQWIHKVKIHPKMIYNRPPLNCQKCQFRFFTDQGLERHLLGSHGLVTSSMQEAANKGKDAGRCPVCGRVYQWKLLNHVARDHNLTLKPAHLSYKCTVCTATFGMYKQFENHVYSAHSVVAKRVMDKTKPPPPKNDALLKINDEITIIPQPVKTPAGKDK